MARFNQETADKYGGQGTAGFFSLKNDKDWAAVRYMYNSFEDIENEACLSVHEVQVNGKKRYVNCIREYNEPLDVCPLCQAQYKLMAKVFLHLYDVDSDSIKIWDRGKSILGDMSSLCARYNPLVATPMELERNGKKGSTDTKYVNFPQETDNVSFNSLPEFEPILGGFVLDVDAEAMYTFLDTGSFPQDEQQGNQSNERNPGNDRRPRQSSQQQAPSRQPAARPAPARQAPARQEAPPAERNAGRSNTRTENPVPGNSRTSGRNQTPPVAPQRPSRGSHQDDFNGFQAIDGDDDIPF